MLDESEWTKVASSGGRATMIDGGRYREQQLSIHRHSDGRCMVQGVIKVDGKVVVAKSAAFTGSPQPAMKDIAAQLGIDGHSIEKCIESFARTST